MNWPVKLFITEQLTRLLIVSFVAILLLLPLHAFISTWLGTTIGPLLVWKSWKEILLLLLVPAVIGYCFLQPDVVKIIWSRLINKLVAVYVVLNLLMVLFAQASNEAMIAGLLMNLRFLAIFVLAQLIVASGHPWLERLKAWTAQWLLWTMIGLAIMAMLQVTLLPKDFFIQFGYSKDATIAPLVLVDDNPDALRAFATMRGPNTLGAYLLIPLAVAAYYLYKRRYVILSASSFGLGFVALLLTGSRSAWIGFVVTMVVLALLVLPREKLRSWLRIAALPAVAIGILFLWAATTVPAVRLAVFHSSPSDPHLFEGSTQKHWEATAEGVSDISKNPLGTGPGSAGPASFYNTEDVPRLSENYFIQIGQEVGMTGLLLFVAISVATAHNLYRQRNSLSIVLLASFAGLTCINLFLHAWADDPTAMTWWGLAGLIIANTSFFKKQVG